MLGVRRLGPRARRLRRLISRYRVDGRLPPQVRELYAEVYRSRFREAAQRMAARWAPVKGSPLPGGSVARHGRRRWHTLGPLTSSFNDLGRENCRKIVEVLEGAGLRPFVHGKIGDRYLIGLDLSERDAAVDGLSRSELAGWCVVWERGRRRRTAPLSPNAHLARRPTQLELTSLWANGDHVGGFESTVIIDFWEAGTSGDRELVGVRGLERFSASAAETEVELDAMAVPTLTAFALDSGVERFSDPIDVVYTWVDGDDPVWKRDFERHLAFSAATPPTADSITSGRFTSRDELRYSMRSIHFLCGWVRHIFILTNGQQPDWLAAHPKVTLISHEQILPPTALPTFNSHAIEAALHLVPGLSEHFIYMNDDVFIGRPLAPESFFTPSGLIRYFSSRARIPIADESDLRSVDAAAIRNRGLLLDRFGRAPVFKPAHAPFALERSVLEEVCSEWSAEIEATMHHRFRHPDDVSVASSLAQQYALLTGRAVDDDMIIDYVNVESGRLTTHLDRLTLLRQAGAFCVNETELSAVDTAETDRILKRFFRTYFPQPAPWERW